MKSEVGAKRYETVIRGDGLEFLNVGKIRDQSADDLVELFDAFIRNRLYRLQADDKVICGKVIEDMTEPLRRELHFE